jgi:hypothetical protein
MKNTCADSQNIVVGPVTHDDWYTMRQLNSAIKYMKQRPMFYAEAITKEQDIYAEIRSKYI